jgi:hypothetical protein
MGKSNRPAFRRGTLSGGVSTEIYLGRSVRIIYFGTLEALLSSGCLTSSMLELRKKFRPGDSRGLHDEVAGRFNMHRLPTKAMPQRMKLIRWMSLEAAVQLPGVRELFPEGVAPPPVEPDDPTEVKPRSVTARVWKSEQIQGIGEALGALNYDRKQWLGLGKGVALFRFTDRDVQRLEAIIGRFRGEMSAALDRATVVDIQGTGLPSFLRLVVDNSRGTNHG